MKNSTESSKVRRVLLIHPGIEETGRKKVFPPWGIIFVAQALTRAGHEAKVVDLNGEPELEKRVPELVQTFKPDVLGITCKWGHSARRAERIFALSAQLYPEIRRVMGGPLASTLPSDARIAKLPHAILAGDGEVSMLRWIDSGMPCVRQTIPTQDADLALSSLDAHAVLDLAPYIQPPAQCDLGVSSLYILLNDVSELIVEQLLEGDCSEQDLIEKIQAQFDVPAETNLVDDIKAFLARLRGYGLLT